MPKKFKNITINIFSDDISDAIELFEKQNCKSLDIEYNGDDTNPFALLNIKVKSEDSLVFLLSNGFINSNMNDVESLKNICKSVKWL